MLHRREVVARRQPGQRAGREFVGGEVRDPQDALPEGSLPPCRQPLFFGYPSAELGSVYWGIAPFGVASPEPVVGPSSEVLPHRPGRQYLARIAIQTPGPSWSVTVPEVG